MASKEEAWDEATLHKPRILCLHGGGVSAAIFKIQARALIRALPDFRLVFADGPFLCEPGPGIIPVYQEHGPFRRWWRWLPEHPALADDAVVDEIMYNIDSCKRADGGDGEWVGVLGFSQGAKLTSSLLYDQQFRREEGLEVTTDYKFGVLLAGRSPIVSLGPHSRSPALVNAGDVTEGFRYEGPSPDVLKIPTLHVHGSNDPGLPLHRRMMDQYHDPDTVTLLEWDGNHRVPIKKADVDPVAREIYRLAREQGVKSEGKWLLSRSSI